MSSLDELDDDYTKKKASYDNLPTFKREMTERYDTVITILVYFIIPLLVFVVQNEPSLSAQGVRIRFFIGRQSKNS